MATLHRLINIGHVSNNLHYNKNVNTDTNMQHKTVLITGATDGLGRQVALRLAQMDAHVIIHGRNPEKALRVQQEIISITGNQQVEFLIADLQSLAQVRSLATEVMQRTSKLDVLINNAGVFMPRRKLSLDGHEMTFAVNHLAPFLLTTLLLDLLKKSAPARVVTVSSVGHKYVYLNPTDLQGKHFFWNWVAYCRSKLLNILFTFELARRLKGSGVTANAVHPGVIRETNLAKTAWIKFGIGLEEGAESIVHLAVSPTVEGISGKYFHHKDIGKPSPIAYVKKLQRKLWQLSAAMTGVY